MPQFRKKPVVIEAEQYIPGVHTPEGVFHLSGQDCSLKGTPNENQPHIHTLEGETLVSPGDWIITGVKGEKYPCKPDIFEATYEPVN